MGVSDSPTSVLDPRNTDGQATARPAIPSISFGATQTLSQAKWVYPALKYHPNSFHAPTISTKERGFWFMKKEDAHEHSTQLLAMLPPDFLLPNLIILNLLLAFPVEFVISLS